MSVKGPEPGWGSLYDAQIDPLTLHSGSKSEQSLRRPWYHRLIALKLKACSDETLKTTGLLWQPALKVQSEPLGLRVYLQKSIKNILT